MCIVQWLHKVAVLARSVTWLLGHLALFCFWRLLPFRACQLLGRVACLLLYWLCVWVVRVCRVCGTWLDSLFVDVLLVHWLISEWFRQSVTWLFDMLPRSGLWWLCYYVLVISWVVCNIVMYCQLINLFSDCIHCCHLAFIVFCNYWKDSNWHAQSIRYLSWTISIIRSSITIEFPSLSYLVVHFAVYTALSFITFYYTYSSWFIYSSRTSVISNRSHN